MIDKYLHYDIHFKLIEIGRKRVHSYIINIDSPSLYYVVCVNFFGIIVAFFFALRRQYKIRITKKSNKKPDYFL